MFTVRGKNYKCSREGPELDLKCGLLFRNVLQIDKIMIKPIQQMKVPLKLQLNYISILILITTRRMFCQRMFSQRQHYITQHWPHRIRRRSEQKDPFKKILLYFPLAHTRQCFQNISILHCLRISMTVLL